MQQMARCVSRQLAAELWECLLCQASRSAIANRSPGLQTQGTCGTSTMVCSQQQEHYAYMTIARTSSSMLHRRKAAC